jgi:Skp family chaperone for outer membrane proteins
MRILRFTLLALFITAVSAVCVSAQGTRPATPAAPAGGATVAIPDAKIAIVNSNAFYDDKAGITRLYKALEGVEREFDIKRKELAALNDDITKKTTELDTLQRQYTDGGPIKASDIQTKAADLEQLKKDLQRKYQDAQDAYKRRTSEVQAPINEDIVKALDVFAKARGITLTLDVAKIAEAIMTVVPTMDITEAFIKDYNSRNPATAAVVRP